jgi:hypothetical protein
MDVAGVLVDWQFLDNAETYLGEGYTETIAGSGRFVSADGMRIVRYGAHETASLVHHAHFESAAGGYVTENSRVLIIPDPPRIR